MLFREKRQILICVVAAAMLGGFVQFRYLPLRKKMAAVDQMKAAQKAAATKALAESGQLPVLREQLAKLKTEVGDCDARIPDHRDLGAFLHTIANLMNEHNLREQLIRPGAEMQAEGLSCIPLSMQCKGRLKQVFDFFSSLQALDRLVRIEQIRLENDSDFSGELSMQAQAVIYYRPQAGRG